MVNKKIVFYVIALFFGVNFNPSYAMDVKLLTLRAVQLLAGGFFIKKGLDKANESNEILKNPVCGEPMPPLVQEWARQELEKLHIPQADSIPLLSYGGGWAVINDKTIVNSAQEISKIEVMLQKKQVLQQGLSALSEKRLLLEKKDRYQKSVHIFPLIQKYSKNDCDKLDKDIISFKEKVDIIDKALAREAMSEKHEVCHLIHQDHKARIYAVAWMPLVVQAGACGLSYGVNRLLKVQSPKTWSDVIYRSLLAEASMTPKVTASYLGLKAYVRYQEKRADRFAYENAENRMQIEEFSKMWRERKEAFEESEGLVNAFENEKRVKHFLSDQNHPWCGDRAAMGKPYLDEWDRRHLAIEETHG